MESLINFLEQYWGVTIVGGLTLGTIVTFIVVQVKSFISDRLKNLKIDELIKLVDDVTATAKQIEKERDMAVARINYLERVQAANFKSIAYIVMASKLPTEDKLILQAEYNKLAEESTTFKVEHTVDKPITNSAKDTIKTVVEDTVPVIIQEAIEGTANLLSKYIKEK